MKDARRQKPVIDQFRHALPCESVSLAVSLGNIWLTINIGGGPTDDKPEVAAE